MEKKKMLKLPWENRCEEIAANHATDLEQASELKKKKTALQTETFQEEQKNLHD
jgi:hypothetical protein